MTAEIWTRLGIPPTTDQATLRRAYAERLRQVRPDIDPAGFRALREAFDAARRMAAGDAAPVTRAAVLQSEGPRADGRKAAESAAETIRGLLLSGHLLEAARVWNRGVAVGDIGFDEEPVLQTDIARATVDTPGVDLALLDEANRLMRWDEAAIALHAPPAVIDVTARRAALSWLAGMQEAARGWWRWSASARRRNRAARLLLRGAPGPITRWFPYVLLNADYNQWLSDEPTHRSWLGETVHPARIAWCRASRRRADARILAVLFQTLFVFLLPSIVGCVLLGTVVALFAAR